MNVLSHYSLWLMGLARASTQTTEEERACLAKHARGCRRLAEIGVWHGVTTARLRSVMASDGVLYAVDPYPVGRFGISFQQRIAHAEVSRVAVGRVEWLRLTGGAAARHIADHNLGPMDFLFIDGNHTYDGLQEDWESWSGLIAPGSGIVALHDSFPAEGRGIDDAGSVAYTRDVIRRDLRFRVVEVTETVTVLQRRPLLEGVDAAPASSMTANGLGSDRT